MKPADGSRARSPCFCLIFVEETSLPAVQDDNQSLFKLRVLFLQFSFHLFSYFFSTITFESIIFTFVFFASVKRAVTGQEMGGQTQIDGCEQADSVVRSLKRLELSFR